MSRLLLIVIFISYQATSANQHSMKNEDILFLGKLVEQPSEAPRCGDIKVAVAYKFRIEKLIRGQSNEEFLVVLIPCPDLKGDSFFTINSDYHIEATNDLEHARSYTIYSDYGKTALLWALDIKKALE